MDARAKIEHAIEPSNHGRTADAQPLVDDPDEEERAFIREMMKESRRTTAKVIERLYGPISISE